MTNKKQYYDNLISRDGGELGVSNLDEAYAFCKKLAKSHYENFPVGSMLVPRAVRKYFYSIYAYSRIADDLGDEYPDTLERRLEIINQFETLLEIKYKNGEKANPIFLALHDTIKQKNIPLTPFKNLLEAFRKDCRFTPYQTKNELLEYCVYSANPVGHLVLYLFEEFNEENAKYSDMICSALQLANFWQDISRDKKIGRCYIPKEILKFDGDDINLLAYLENKSKTDEFAKVMNNLRKWTDDLFQEGSKLLNNIKSPRLRLELKAIIAGGRAIVRATAKQGINIYEVRPSINKLRIFINLIFGR